MKRALWIITLVAMLTHAAQANEDGDALRNFDLVGHWAVDCTAPASSTNPHSRYIISDGWGPVYQVSMGSPQLDSAWSVRGVMAIGEDRFALAFSIGAATFANIVLQKANDRIKSLESTTGSGQVIIHEGRLIRTGQETPWLERCPNGSLG